MEIEMKYSIPDKEAADKLWEDKYLSSMEEAGSRETVYMKAVYFDTEDGILSKNDIALRVRTEGNRTFATLKWAGKNEGAFYTREEVNVPVNDAACLIMPDPAIFKESEIGQELISLVNGRPLFSNVEMGILRRRFRLDTGESIIEMSVDNGEIITKNGVSTVCELELELFSGNRDELLRIGEDLKARYALKEELRSKYARGLALVNSKKEK